MSDRCLLWKSSSSTCLRSQYVLIFCIQWLENCLLLMSSLFLVHHFFNFAYSSKKLQGFKWSEILRRATNSQLLLNVEWKYWRESRRRWRLDYRFFRFSSCQEFLSSFSSKKLKNELYNLKWQLSQKNWFFVAWPQKVFFVVGQTFKLREDQYNWCMMPKSGYNFKYRSITDYSNPRRV